MLSKQVKELQKGLANLQAQLDMAQASNTNERLRVSEAGLDVTGINAILIVSVIGGVLFLILGLCLIFIYFKSNKGMTFLTQELRNVSQYISSTRTNDSPPFNSSFLPNVSSVFYTAEDNSASLI